MDKEHVGWNLHEDISNEEEMQSGCILSGGYVRRLSMSETFAVTMTFGCH